MTETIENLFYFLVYLTDIIIVAFFLTSFKKLDNRLVFKIIALYCLIDIATNLTIEYFPFKGIKFLYSFFTFAEYILFALVLSFVIRNKVFKKIIFINSLLFSIFLTFYFLTARPRSIDSIPIGVETILLLVYSFYYLLEQMNDLSERLIYNRYHFWVVTGIMLYLSGSFFIYVFANQVDKQTLSQYWFLTNVFYIVKNILFVIAILTYVKQLKNPRPEKLYPYLN